MRDALATLAARRLGLAPHEAAVLLAAARAALGRRAFAFRATAFAVAVARPAKLLPHEVRRRAIAGFTGPLLQHPAALNLYGAGRPWERADGCAGLVDGA